MTERLSPTASGLARAATLLADGALVAFPTDTVYGVACAASRRDRVGDLFVLKRRPADRQIPMLVRDLADAIAQGHQADARAHALAGRWWPGGLTLVLTATDGGASQAFRAPDHAVAQDLIRAAGPLLATSANVSGEPDALDADDVLIAFATQNDLLAAVVDGGRVPGGVASTVVDLSLAPARILREGAVARAALEELLELEPAPAG